jgi:hypothetical protein
MQKQRPVKKDLTTSKKVVKPKWNHRKYGTAGMQEWVLSTLV